MAIDILFLILLLLAIFKGLQQGFIVAVFSVLALVAGLAAAIKLSVVVANHLRTQMHFDGKWLPLLAFLLVFIGVALLVRWAAGLIKMAVDFVLLGWADKIAGIILYAFIYITIYSVLLFYASNLHLISAETENTSKTYHFIMPWGPYMIDQIGKLIPFFKNMFVELQSFFSHIA
ncbi:MAG: CvpA family protein [Bacteroidetes bacterium]|nr:CvpA family protein [Bacteroidota bacterium]